MNGKGQSTKRKVKDPFLQVSESFFEKQEVMDIQSKYGYQGIGIYLKLTMMLLKNQGMMKFNPSYFSTKKSEQKIISDIISDYGLFYFNEDKTAFGSYEVDEQLEERGKISKVQSERAKRGWYKRKNEHNPKYKLNVISKEEADRLDGITPRK